MIRQPGVLDAGRVVDDLVNNVGVFATLLEMAETSASVVDTGTIAGQSFAPLLHGDTDSYDPRERVFSGMTWHDRYNPIRAVRTECWKYIRNFWHLPAVYMTTDTYCTNAGREVSEEYYGE